MKTFLSIAIASFSFACGSGGSDPPSGASSSGGSSSTSSSGGSSGAGSSGGASSSGANNCEAICTGGARITIDEDNTGDRLDSATVMACHGSVCATGILGKNSQGVYSLSLVKAKDQSSPPSIQVNVTAPSAAILRIQIVWDYGQDATKLVDGDKYTVAARAGDGPILFDRTFTATYVDETVCGSKCKVYELKP